MNYFKVSTVQMKKIEICQPFQKPLPCTPSQSHIPSSRKWPPVRPAFHSDHFLTFSFFIVLSPKCAFLEAIFYCRPFKNTSRIFFFSHKYLLICRFLLFYPSLAYRPLTCTVSHSLDFFYLRACGAGQCVPLSSVFPANRQLIQRLIQITGSISLAKPSVLYSKAIKGTHCLVIFCDLSRCIMTISIIHWGGCQMLIIWYYHFFSFF